MRGGNNFRQKEFTNNLDNLFDIAHSNALQLIKIEEDKKFLLAQRQPGRIGCIGGIDKVLSEKENRSAKRRHAEAERQHLHKQKFPNLAVSTPVAGSDSTDLMTANITSSDVEVSDLTEPIEDLTTCTKRGKIEFITPKLVAALDRCKLSVRNAVFILQAAAEALGHDVDSLIINSTSIHRCRKKLRAERSEFIKEGFKASLTGSYVIHWDGKLLPSLGIK